MNPAKTAIVIGAGFGGLALAIRLQAAGIHTTLLEKRDQPGGRAYVYRDQGFTFDAGPTVDLLALANTGGTSPVRSLVLLRGSGERALAAANAEIERERCRHSGQPPCGRPSESRPRLAGKLKPIQTARITL